MAQEGTKNILKNANGDLSPVQGENNPAGCVQRVNRNAFMSPTDNFFSPCTQRLVSRRGVAALVLKNKKFVSDSEVANNESSKENSK